MLADHCVRPFPKSSVTQEKKWIQSSAILQAVLFELGHDFGNFDVATAPNDADANFGILLPRCGFLLCNGVYPFFETP